MNGMFKDLWMVWRTMFVCLPLGVRVFWCLAVVFGMALTSAIIYVGLHFVTKYW